MSLPWELNPVLTEDRLVTLAGVAVSARNRAFAEADRAAGDTNWGLACKAHERLMFALGRLAADGEHPWLTVTRDGLYLMPRIEDVPVKVFRGSAERIGSRHLDVLRLEHERSQAAAPQMAFDFMVGGEDDGGRWYWLMALETDVAGMVARVVYVQANDAGETRYPWVCPLEDAPRRLPTVQLVARPDSVAVPPRRSLRPRASASVARTRKARTLARVHRVMGLVELLVPARIADEELGDALERIAAMLAADQAPWRAYVVMVATVFWVLVHAVHAVLRGLPQKKGG